ncbi:hypothetical protein JFK97_11060 [Chromobacterium phragmitis]|uniref:hypothetical protein n=1 Tax=Chromobacterium amazonense TaxID=1382803 RepID=UPI0021B84DBF|nr:hypothetical protein [Chromobacterium amazonense]MBM2884927.1 hypothetical protein [Chromobacterium amazonense]MDE1714726.1 hypothetical protein [Chromobacterium amazonense]
MAKYDMSISAYNGHPARDLGIVEAKTAQEARDAVARIEGYADEADMRAKLGGPSGIYASPNYRFEIGEFALDTNAVDTYTAVLLFVDDKLVDRYKIGPGIPAPRQPDWELMQEAAAQLADKHGLEFTGKTVISRNRWLSQWRGD